jgi:uncharacterized protein (TIGR03435 family)
MLQRARRAPRTIQLAAISITLAAHLASAQADTPQPAAAFDVVSIRVVAPDTRITMLGLRYTPDGIECQSVTVAMLIRAAYGGFVKFPTDDRVTGLPDWAKTENFQLQAKMSEAQAAEFKDLSQDDKDKRRQAMLQAVLADRFQLKAHLESKQAPVYELVPAKGGPKLKESDTNPDGVKGPDGKPIAGSYLRMYGTGKIAAQAFTMEQLTNFLAQPPVDLGRSVVDKTGLTGKYSFALNWSPEPGLIPGTMTGLQPPPPAADSSGPSIFTALQEQLGLRLQPAAGAIQLIAVDHVERPSEN